MPLPPRSGIRIRPIDGASGVLALPAGRADALILDAFLGGRVPAEFTAPAFVAEVVRVLRPGGVLLANLPDGPPLTYLRRVLATLRLSFDHTIVVADATVLRGRRFGNVVVAASNEPLPEAEVARAAAAAAFPRRMRGNADDEHPDQRCSAVHRIRFDPLARSTRAGLAGRALGRTFGGRSTMAG